MIPNSPFDIVSKMNVAFNNAKGDPLNINWERIEKQCLNVPDEVGELFKALGGHAKNSEGDVFIKAAVKAFKAALIQSLTLDDDGRQPVDVEGVRDALCDIPVFTHGAQHLMGIDGDIDIATVIVGVMTRFIKDDADKAATIAKHAANGITDVYFEGAYPTMIMKSASDQDDAPQGKFLKSASFKEAVFYDPSFYSYTQHFDLTELPVTYWSPYVGQSQRGWVHHDDLASWLMAKGYGVKLDSDHPENANDTSYKL